MNNKVVYAIIITLLSLTFNGYAQKTTLILLPGGSGYAWSAVVDQKEIRPDNTQPEISLEARSVTPQVTKEKRFRFKTGSRIWNMIGKHYKERWSRRLVKLFRLPVTSGITIY